VIHEPINDARVRREIAQLEAKVISLNSALRSVASATIRACDALAALTGRLRRFKAAIRVQKQFRRQRQRRRRAKARG
jgi:hypothetical protein